MDTVTCAWCGESKSQSEFYTNGKNRFRTECKHCSLLAQKARKHGTTVNFLVSLWEFQNYSCWICSTKMDLLKLHVDHDHTCCPARESGNYCGDCIRGLLCSDCNLGLGLFRDNPKFLSSAFVYVDPEFKHLNPAVALKEHFRGLSSVG